MGMRKGLIIHGSILLGSELKIELWKKIIKTAKQSNYDGPLVKPMGKDGLGSSEQAWRA
jgi:hypothetical protein